MSKITACIITQNNEQTIIPCLESFAWADEIVVIDLKSHDQTIELCSRFTDKIHVFELAPDLDLGQTVLKTCRSEWIIFIDPSELCSDQWVNEIKDILKKNDSVAYCREKEYYLKNVLFPDHELFPRNKLTLFKLEWIKGFKNSEFLLKENIRCEKFSYYPNVQDQLSLTEILERINKLSAVKAVKDISVKKINFSAFLFPPTGVFFNYYIWKKYFLKGLSGLLISWLMAFYKMLYVMKIWYLQRKELS